MGMRRGGAGGVGAGPELRQALGPGRGLPGLPHPHGAPRLRLGGGPRHLRPPPQEHRPGKGPPVSPAPHGSRQCLRLPELARASGPWLGGSPSLVPSPHRCRASLPQGHWGPSQAGGQESGPWEGGLSLSQRRQPSATTPRYTVSPSLLPVLQFKPEPAGTFLQRRVPANRVTGPCFPSSTLFTPRAKVQLGGEERGTRPGDTAARLPQGRCHLGRGDTGLRVQAKLYDTGVISGLPASADSRVLGRWYRLSSCLLHFGLIVPQDGRVVCKLGPGSGSTQRCRRASGRVQAPIDEPRFAEVYDHGPRPGWTGTGAWVPPGLRVGTGVSQDKGWDKRVTHPSVRGRESGASLQPARELPAAQRPTRNCPVSAGPRCLLAGPQALAATHPGPLGRML